MEMRRFFSAVLEQGNSFSQDFETEPFEAGWAREARWFIRLLEASGTDVVLDAMPQISPDGLVWCDDDGMAEGVRLSAGTPAPALVSFRQREFGNWLRLKVRLSGSQPNVKVLIYLALKE
jgi:hypothetical protein